MLLLPCSPPIALGCLHLRAAIRLQAMPACPHRAGSSQLGDSDVAMVAFGTQQTTVGAFMTSYFDYDFSFIW